MQTVNKFTMELSEVEKLAFGEKTKSVTFPEGAKILSVKNQYGNKLAIWFMADNDVDTVEDYLLTIIGTGPSGQTRNLTDESNFLGTVLFEEDSLVFHVFYKKVEYKISAMNPDDVFMIGDHEVIDGFLIKRVNSDSFDVFREGKLVFRGDDYEVANYLEAERLDTAF